MLASHWLESLIAVVVVVSVLVPLARMSLTKAAKTGAWSQALAQVSQQLGLQATANPEFFDHSMGEIGGHRVFVRVDPGKDGMTYRMKAEVSVSCDRGLMIKQRGAPTLDCESRVGPPTPTQDPQFDQAVDLRGAQPPLLRALQQQPALRQLIMQCTQAGTWLDTHDLKVKATSIPTSVEEIRSYLDPLLDMARRIEDPGGAHTAPPVGTPMAARIGAIGHLSSEQRLPHYQAVVGEIGARVGQGQAYAMPNDSKVEWRGSYQGVPVRIQIGSSTSVEIQAKVQNPHGTISLTCDPSKVEQQVPQDAWSAGETVYMFIGRGVYFDGSQADVDLEAARLRSLGPDAAGAVARGMSNDRIRYFRVYPEHVEASFRPDLDEMLDPEGQLVRTAQLVGWLAQLVQSTPPDPSIAQAAAQGWQTVQLAPLQKHTCRYCNTLFLMTGNRYDCPNCGAPAQA